MYYSEASFVLSSTSNVCMIVWVNTETAPQSLVDNFVGIPPVMNTITFFVQHEPDNPIFLCLR